MERVVRERVAVDRSPPAAYRRIDGRALLERGERGWPETVVCANPVASFRSRRDGGVPDELDVGGCARSAGSTVSAPRSPTPSSRSRTGS